MPKKSFFSTFFDKNIYLFDKIRRKNTCENVRKIYFAYFLLFF